MGRTILFAVFTNTVLVLLTFGISLSQVTQEWVAIYNGPGNSFDITNSLAVDSSGNVYVTGYSILSGTETNYITIKYNSSGLQVWAAIYTGVGNSYNASNSVTVDGSGNVYVTGTSDGNGTGRDYATIKYNEAGTEQWVAIYNGVANSSDEARSIAIDGSGNIYVTGQSFSDSSEYDYATVKYNSAGEQLWIARFNGPGNSDDYAFSISVDRSNNVYVTGSSTTSGGFSDYATIKYNSTGVQQWISFYNGPGNLADESTSIKLDNSDNIYITGYSTDSGGVPNQDYTTIKYNSSGIEQWVARYNGPGNSSDFANSIDVDSLGNVFITGESIGIGTGNDYCTIKYNSAGVQQWTRRYNGSEPAALNDYAHSLIVDNSGYVYVTGQSDLGVGSGSRNFVTLKYNSDGDSIWVARYTRYGQDAAVSIRLDRYGNAFVTGRSPGNATETDFVTIKYSQPTGINQISTELPEQFSLLQNYPNPFNPSTNIQFEISKTAHAKLYVFDALGRIVANLVDKQLQPGIYEAQFNGSNLTSGVYFYKLETETFSETKKLLLLK